MKYKVQCKYVVTKDYKGNIVEQGEKKYYIVHLAYKLANGKEMWNKVRVGRTCPAYSVKKEAMQALKKITYKEIIEENYTLE